MKKIYLTGEKGKGVFAIVDDDDYEELNKQKWYLSNKGYACRGIRSKQLPFGYKTIFMHRLVNKTPEKYLTDHKNRNKLDNRKINLRTATEAENRYNVIRKDNKSGVPGVSWYKHTNKWLAYIWVNKKMINLGYFKDFEQAVSARKLALEQYDVLCPIES